MGAYFPQVYPDELIYSVLARYHLHSGYLYYKDTEQDLFRSKQGRVDKEFVKQLRPEIVEQLTKNITMEELLEKHTMYPFYGRFIDGNRRNKAFEALMSMEGDFSKLFCVPQLRKGEQRYMRYCPLCVRNDRKQYGETYWHRLHQMRNVNLCTVHGCCLIDTVVSFDSRESVNLVSAEEVIPLGEDISGYVAYYNIPLELELVQYMAKVFIQPMDRNSTVLVKDFLHSKMVGTAYLSSRGEHKYFHKLWEDMRAFYSGIAEMGNILDGHIQRMLGGGRFVFSEICMTAMFLQISAEELAGMETPIKTPEQMFDEKVMELADAGMGIKAIAREMGVSSSMVGMAVKLGKMGNRERKYNTRHSNTLDWEELDTKMLPMVKSAIYDLHGNGEKRPQKVSFYAVSKRLNIPSHRLIKMEQCKKEIEQHIESIEQYRARKVIWAVNVLQSEEKPLICWRICAVTKLEKEEIISSLPYLKEIAEPELYEMVLGAL